MRQPVLFLFSFLFLSLLIGYNVYYSYNHWGQLVYPLDDAYIHMSISKNLQQHGVWGITQFEFSSTSSSLLYTLLLAGGFAIFGIHSWLPLAINWLVAAAITWLLSRISLRYINGWTALVFNFLFIAIVPVAAMSVLGMEHTLQIFFCTWFAWLTYRKWNEEDVPDLLYASVALLSVATRYESVFLVGITGAVWLFVFRNIRMVILLAFAAILPVVVFGIYAISQGGYFFPNSLLAKSNYVNGGVFGFVTEASKKIINNSLLAALLLLPVLYWMLFPAGTWRDLAKRKNHLLWLVIGLTCILHQLFASFGWMFRYEAYLIALVFAGCLITWNDWQHVWKEKQPLTRVVVAILAFMILLPLVIRLQVPSFANRAMKNIHDQHLQMAALVKESFPAAGIAMNDIGTTTFFNDSMRLFDMEGLGTLEILKVKKQFDSSFLRQYVAKHNISIGIFYPHLYKGKIPSTWEQVGSWEIRDRFVAAGSEVGFYVIDPSQREKMIEALRQYSSRLPADVMQRGIYVGLDGGTVEQRNGGTDEQMNR